MGSSFARERHVAKGEGPVLASSTKNKSRKQTSRKANGKLTLALGPGTMTKVYLLRGSPDVVTSPVTFPCSSPYNSLL